MNRQATIMCEDLSTIYIFLIKNLFNKFHTLPPEKKSSLSIVFGEFIEHINVFTRWRQVWRVRDVEREL